MTKFRILAVLITLLVASPMLQAAEDEGQSRAEATVFQTLTEDERKVVLGNLQNLLSSSIDAALTQIHQQGGVKPFAYIGDYEGQGRFLRFSEDQAVPPDVAVHAIQRSVVKAATDGTLAASLLYITTGGSDHLSNDTLAQFRAEEEADGRTLEDLRYLLIEMQHLAGLGILHVVPYWREGEEWQVGGAIQQVIEPRLHDLVKARLQPSDT